MTLSATLWNTNKGLAEDCLRHPFVQGIASGSLPREAFAYYVGQDAFFLQAFARAYSIAAAKAPDWDGFRTLHRLTGGVLEELKLHADYAARWGVMMDHVEPGVATCRYTDFLLATAWAAATGTAAAALSPCMRLYAFLGQSLAQEGIPGHAYAAWIETYQNEAFKTLAEELDGLIDRYAIDTIELHRIYRYAMQCELDFFEAAWGTTTV